MIITSIYTYFAIIFRNKIPNKEWFLPSFILGLTIPDLDTFLVNFNLLNNINYNNTFGHSIVSILLVYLILLIIYEINKKSKYLNLANGITLGILLHISLDLIISLNSMNIFWPIPFNSIYLYDNLFFRYYLKTFINIVTFMSFRYFYFQTIEFIIQNNNKDGKLIQFLNIMMKFQFAIIILYLITIMFEQKKLTILVFNTGYLISMISLYIGLLKGWKSFKIYKDNSEKDIIFKKEREMINLN
tara:strand:+ start:3446 stop:4177 length:732 start_codon:yes stop_codon:yes gene_type:complete